MSQDEEVVTSADPAYSYGIGRKFPDDWTDEQVQRWNDDHCDCPFHITQRIAQKEKPDA